MNWQSYFDTKGFTVTEILIASAITSVTMVFMTQAVVRGLAQNQASTQYLEIYRQATDLEFTLHNLLGRAVNTNYINTNNVGFNNKAFTGGSPGSITDFDSTKLANNNTITTTIAIFLREIGPQNNRSQFSPTAIYFQQPTQATSGMVYIDVAGTSGTPYTVSPARDKVTYSNLTEFHITVEPVPPAFPTNTPLSFINIEYTMRIFLSGNGTKSWCPGTQLTVAACKTNLPFRDLTKSFRIDFLNNNIVGSSRLLGNLYFFRFFSPAR